MIAYKVLREDGTSVFTSHRWALPDGGSGGWVEAPVAVCRSGLHACRAVDLPLWIGHGLYEIELEGEIVEDRSKLVASRARLLRRLEAWDGDARDAYTRTCADRAHALARGASPPLADWDASIERLVRFGPALLGFMAARIAQERDGVEAYRAERGHQAAWLAARLGLPGGARGHGPASSA